MKAVDQNGSSLKYASEELQSNKDVVLKAVEQNKVTLSLNAIKDHLTFKQLAVD